MCNFFKIFLKWITSLFKKSHSVDNKKTDEINNSELDLTLSDLKISEVSSLETIDYISDDDISKYK